MQFAQLEWEITAFRRDWMTARGIAERANGVDKTDVPALGLVR